MLSLAHVSLGKNIIYYIQIAPIAPASTFTLHVNLNVGKIKSKVSPWNNGNRHPGWGVAEIQKMSPPKL